MLRKSELELFNKLIEENEFHFLNSVINLVFKFDES